MTTSTGASTCLNILELVTLTYGPTFGVQETELWFHSRRLIDFVGLEETLS